MVKRRIILSSRSPRRIELLGHLGLEFDVHPSEINERTIQATHPREFTLKAAFLKALEVAQYYDDAIIIAADTVVVVDDAILGKPQDEDDARRMLRRLSGRTHQVITGMAVADARTGSTLIDAVSTDVHFRTLSEEDIDQYVKSGDPMDKAGAYGIQTIGDRFVDMIDGDYHNVVGLPITKLREMLDLFLSLPGYPKSSG